MIAVVLLVLALFIAAAFQVDNWSRDLTTNRAATSHDNADHSLRSLELSASVEEVREAITRFAASRADWSSGESTRTKDEEVVVPIIRTSRLFRFADDVYVSLHSTQVGTLVDVVSQSRVGKGDFGQNPRNIRELLQSLRNTFDVAPSSADE